MEDCTTHPIQRKYPSITSQEMAQDSSASSTDTAAVRSASTAPTSSPTYLPLTQIFEDEIYKEKHNVKAAVTKVMSKTDEQLKLVGASDTGTTCCLAYIRKEGAKRMCYIANVGDSRAVLCVEGIAKRVSIDHKPITLSEIERIK
jgi:serine/threonine protein phosphatase PrpC